MAVLVLFVTGLFAWLVVKNVTESIAAEKAQSMIAKATGDEAYKPARVIDIADAVFENFKHQEPTNVLLLRLRPYLTNRRLPEFLRLKDGVIETFVQTGLCDNAGRMLAFALEQEGIDSVQWNMVSPTGGHSVLAVSMPDGRGQVLVDPFFGVVTRYRGTFISPKKAQELARGGTSYKDVFQIFSDKSDLSFYRKFADTAMAAEGEDLKLEATLPQIDDVLAFGEIDGSEKDVRSASKKGGFGPYWNYMGHKYNREWVRVMHTDQDVKIVMTLIDPVEEGVMIADPAPQVDGKTLTWRLKAGDSLTLHDGRAQISLRRMNSYIGIDKIAFYPEGA